MAGVGAKEVMDLMLVTQYFDMMKDIGADSKSNAIFMTHSPAALSGLTEALSNGIMHSMPAVSSLAGPLGNNQMARS